MRPTPAALRRVSIVGSLLAILLGVPLVWQSYWRLPGQIDFFLHAAEYAKIVQTAKALRVAPGAKQAYTSMVGKRKVWIARSKECGYAISFVTTDWGHMGTSGYLYVEAPGAEDAPGEIPGELPFIG